MKFENNHGYINLKSENLKDFFDLEVKVRNNNIIDVKTNLINQDGFRYLLGFTIEEIEALYHFTKERDVVYFENDNGYINLKSESLEDFYDLEIEVRNDNVIGVKTNIIDQDGFRHFLGFTVEEIEALYHFSQLVRLKK